MKKRNLILMAAIAAAAAPAAPAAPAVSPPPHRYDVQLRLIEGGKLIASPRLIVVAGKPSTVASDDGQKGWRLSIEARPDHLWTVALSCDLETWSGQGSRRRATTSLLVVEGKPAAFELSPQESLPSMRVELSVNGA